MSSVAVTLFVLAGCTAEPINEFRGQIRAGDAAAGDAPEVHQIALYSGASSPDQSRTLLAYGLMPANACIVIVFDPGRRGAAEWRPTNDVMGEVYYYPMQGAAMIRATGDFWRRFLAMEPAERENLPGVKRLRGQFDIERWEDDIDFRIRLDAKSEDDNPVIVSGLLASYQEWEFNPLEWLALTLHRTGLFGEG